MFDPELFYHGEGGCGYEAEIEEEEFQNEEEEDGAGVDGGGGSNGGGGEEDDEEDDRWMQGWHPSRNKPTNLCKYVRSHGLCTVFPHGNAYKFVVGGQFYGPFPTQKLAQLAAKSLKP
jgi:hypothetical protein